MQTAQIVTEEFARIPLSQLVFNPRNARKFEQNMTPDRARQFDELVASVRIKDVVQPILVRPLDMGLYEVVAGERRTRAKQELARQDGKEFQDVTIPAVIREVGEDEAYDLMFIENDKREDLTPMERAEGYADYLTRHGDTPEALAELSFRTSTPAQTIRRMVNLLRLPSAVLDKWRDGMIHYGHLELFLRLHDEKVILKALTDTLSNKFTVKELKNYIENSAPVLAIAKFDRSDCGTCPHNSSAQGSLFAQADPADKCLNPACFEQKQGAFFKANWEKGRARAVLGTNDFRFANRLDASAYQVIPLERDSALPERCAACAECVSVVQLGGEIVKERVCVGDKTCFDDLYLAKARKAVEQKQAAAPVESDEDNEAMDGADESEKSPATAASAAAAKTKPTTKDKSATRTEGDQDGVLDPKRAARRGQEYREKFYATALPAKVAETAPNSPEAIRMALAALALANTNAKESLMALLGEDKHRSLRHDKTALVKGVFGMEDQQLLPALQQVALRVFQTTDLHAAADPGARHALAQGLGVNLANEWEITKDYLESLTKRELVAIGEEPQVALWKDPKIETRKEQVAPKKALMSMKNPELVQLVLDSGANLRGRTPKEITTLAKVV